MTLNQISIIAGGSRGDIQPYIGIGVALQEAGYEVRILSNTNNACFIESLDLTAVPIFPDMQEMLLKHPVLKKSMAEGDAMVFAECMESVQQESAVDDCTHFLQEMKGNAPDLLIVGTMGQYFGGYASRILRIPIIDIALQAILLDPNHAPLGLPTLPDGGHMDLLKNLFNNMLDKGWKHCDDVMVSLGGKAVLPMYSSNDAVKECLEEPAHERLICQSPLFKDILYPTAHERLSFVGASVLNAKQQDSHREYFGGNTEHDATEAFLEAAEKDQRKVVYCGWGSMMCKSPEHMVLLAVSALMISGHRGIVLGGWADLSLDTLRGATEDASLVQYAEENVLFVKQASHENLFPKVACTVHHGGAGTTNAALRAGVPTIVTPVFMDQYDHAYLISKLGVGVGFDTTKQLQKLTAVELGEAIKRCVADESMAQRAKAFGEKVCAEDGTQNVVTKVEEYWKNHVLTGEYWTIVDGTGADAHRSSKDDRILNLPTLEVAA